MASTSLPLATAAAVATILSGPAGMASADPSNVPTTPAQPGTTNNGGGAPNAAPQQGAPGQSNPGQSNPGQGAPGQSNPGQSIPGQSNPGQSNPGQPNYAAPQPGSPSQPGVNTPQPGVTTPQPGATNPPGQSNPGGQGPALAAPTQPGVTTPRVAPLPVPGQPSQGGTVQPAGVPGQPTPNGSQPGTMQPTQPQDQGVNTPTNPGSPSQSTPQSSQSTPQSSQAQGGTQQPQGGSTQALSGNHGTQQSQPHWSAPSLGAAPAAPVVNMTGPHTEVGADIDGGTLLPGYVANTHHFSNLDGYVGTVGYNTPTGSGDAGVSVEFVEANKIKITGYGHATGANDAKNVGYVDTTQANAAKGAVEGWIRQQPGGTAALDAAGRVGRLTPGELAPQMIHVAGVTTQWGGSVQ